MFAIRQSNSNSEAPFDTTITGSTFRNVQGGTLISADGGSVVMQNTNFEDINTAAIVSSSSGGVVMVTNAAITGSTIVVRSTCSQLVAAL